MAMLSASNPQLAPPEYHRLFAMPNERAGALTNGIMLAAVVLLLLLGLIIYLAWREANPKPKAIPQRTAAAQPNCRGVCAPNPYYLVLTLDATPPRSAVDQP